MKRVEGGGGGGFKGPRFITRVGPNSLSDRWRAMAVCASSPCTGRAAIRQGTSTTRMIYLVSKTPRRETVSPDADFDGLKRGMRGQKRCNDLLEGTLYRFQGFFFNCPFDSFIFLFST